MSTGIRKNLKHYMLLLPFFVLFSIFFLYPIAKGFITSFYKWDIISPPQFVGLKNYISILGSKDFLKAVTNLLKYVSLTVPIGITVAFLLALFVNGLKGFWASFFRSAYFFPTMIPLFLAASIFRWMYQPEVGLFNMALSYLGLPNLGFLSDPGVMIISVLLLDLWRAAGFNMIILLAGLKNIPQDYYDAAKVDGANSFQEVIYITIPQLEPVLFFTITFGFISALQVFDAPWLLSISNNTTYGGQSGGMLYPVMDLMGRAFGHLKFGLSSAYGFILTTVVAIVTAILFTLQRKYKR